MAKKKTRKPARRAVTRKSPTAAKAHVAGKPRRRTREVELTLADAQADLNGTPRPDNPGK